MEILSVGLCVNIDTLVATDKIEKDIHRDIFVYRFPP